MATLAFAFNLRCVGLKCRCPTTARNSRDTGEAILCRSGKDVEARFYGESGAVEDHMVQPWIILTGTEEHPGVGISRSVNFLLVPSRVLFFHAMRDRLGDARFNRPIKSYAKHIGSATQYDHGGSSEHHPAGGIGYLAKLRLTFCSKVLECLGHVCRNLTWTHYRWGVCECHKDSFPTAGDGLIETLSDLGRRGKLVRKPGGNGSIQEGEIESLGKLASNLVAMRAV
jgi:hypothetical protein